MMKRTNYWIFGILLLVSIILLPSHRKSAYTADKPVGMNLVEGDYIDGTYTGIAIGYQPGISVEIEIANGDLTQVRVIDHSEIGRQFYQRPIDFIPDAIVDAQNTEVDVVGGATATSTGIMAAVESALAKAVR